MYRYCSKCQTIMTRQVDVKGKVTYICNTCGRIIEIGREV